MKPLELDSLDAPSKFAKHAVEPAIRDLGQLVAEVKCADVTESAFGFEENGQALAREYGEARQVLVDRLNHDLVVLQGAKEALEMISANYRALVTANTATPR